MPKAPVGCKRAALAARASYGRGRVLPIESCQDRREYVRGGKIPKKSFSGENRMPLFGGKKRLVDWASCAG